MRRLSREVPGENKIVGGEQVVPNSIPYQASLKRLRKDGTFKGFCGGVVISKDHILTAAHCCDVSLMLNILISVKIFIFIKLLKAVFF